MPEISVNAEEPRPDGIAPVTEALADWDTRAGVRADPRRVVRGELEANKTFFPERLIPYLAHPVVAALPEATRREMVARHLYQYLGFTAHFEVRVVNRAAQRIADGRAGFVSAPGLRFDAYKIYCDEAYHAMYCFDMVQQVADASGIRPLPYDFDPFLSRLDGVGARILPDEPELAKLLQVVVFETLVTAILRDVPAERTVLTPVREMVGDHARDEGRHHAYFSGFFRELWTTLDGRLRFKAAQALPELVRESLWPDDRPVRAALAAAGLDRHSVEGVLTEVYRPADVLAAIKQASRQAVRLFRQVGVLDVPGAEEAFQRAGLLP
jgi:hypothetical protein